jgi:hypothetical protein
MTGSKLDILAAKIAERLTIRRWLKLSAAVQYSGMGKTALLDLLRSGNIRGYQANGRGDWIIDRESIDQYHLGNMPDVDKMVAEAMRKIV